MSASHDVLVVGAGSAGAALAARLCDSGADVLLIEAGPDYRTEETPHEWRVPNSARALADPASRAGLVWPDLWATRTAAQEPAFYWRGRGMGGSSAINGQIAIRPPAVDFDAWVSAGCTGWGPADVLPYFARLESDLQFAASPGHGGDGPIPVHRMPQAEWGASDLALRDMAQASGLGWVEDVNGSDEAGVAPYPINSRNGLRISTNDGYLEPRRGRTDLHIVGDCLVERVLFDRERAVGVRCVGKGGVVEHYADSVVLAAGAVGSPTILLRSGIGLSADLALIGLTPRVELPVGHGLQDHAAIMVPVALKRQSTSSMDDRHTNCCVRTTSAGPHSEALDLMMISLNVDVLNHEHANLDAELGAFAVWLNQAHSRGHLELRSADPGAQPILHERMLSDRRDLVRLVEGVRLLASMVQDHADSVGHEARPEAIYPDLWAAIASSDPRALDAYVLANAVDGQHITSTCRMGSPQDRATVVDPDCRVLGIDGLRVVDSSVIPAVTRANTNLVSIMLGERMADRISASS